MNNYKTSTYKPKLIEKLNKINGIVRKKIYYTRKSRNLNQKELGYTIGVSGRKIKSLESHIKDLEVSMFFILCKELDIDITKLFDEISLIID